MPHWKSGYLLSSIALITLASSNLCLAQQAEAPDIGKIPDYDIREFMTGSSQPGGEAAQARLTMRQESVRAFLATRSGSEIRPHISLTRFGLPKVYLREGGALTGPSTLPVEQIALRFLESNAALYPFTARERGDLRLAVKDVGQNATFVVFDQTLGGVPVYEGQIKFVLNLAGEIVQVAAGGISPGLSVSATPRLNGEQAVRAAYASMDASNDSPQLALSLLSNVEGKLSFANPRGGQLNPVTASLVVFPLDATSARLAYRIYLDWGAATSYELVIDSEDGTVLYRRNLVVYEAQGRVWPESPINGVRQVVSFPPAPASGPAPDPWLPADSQVTTGNNVDAFLDSNSDGIPDSGDIAGLQNGRAYSSGRLFDFPFGDGTSLADPRKYQAAAVTNLFYLINTAHDYFYRLGFTEAAGNFQKDNYGRGGLGNDAVTAMAQSAAAANNAAFSPTPEGSTPGIRVGIFTRGTSALTDDMDADYDGDVILHEYAHGVSTRLVGGGKDMSCLAKPMSGAMGEGWSDYFATSFYNNPVVGAYVTADSTKGVRRHSYEGYPYTYEDLGNAGYEVHNDGEIWAATLWDLRKALGQAVTDQIVVNGLKATPCNPTMTDGRDAILAADLAANGGVNRAAIWDVFARHGLGYSASGVDGYANTGIRYDAAYDRPPDLQGIKNPVVTSDPISVTVGLDDDYPYVVKATNPNGGVLHYEIQDGPTGMTIDPATGKITWRATFSGKRTKILVTDGKGGRVVHGYFPPVVTELTPGVSRTISGEANSMGIAFVTIPAGVPVLQASVQNLQTPVMLNLGGQGKGTFFADSNPTAYIAGPAAGKWNVILLGGSQPFSGAVLTVSLVTPQPLGSRSSLTGLSGSLWSDAYYSVNVPAGVPTFTVATSGGTGNVDLDLRMPYPPFGSGSSAAGRFTANNNEVASVTDPTDGAWYIHLHGKDAYAGVTLTVSVGALAMSPDSPLPAGKAGVPYSQTFTASGGAPPYNWSVKAGSLPPGLNLSSGGMLSGTPTAAGLYKWTLRVADSAPSPAVSSLEYSLRIEGTQIMTSATLPDGFLGGAYYQTLSASGGVSPYVWSLLSGPLPPGLSLNSSGLLSGTPKQDGDFSFTAQVRDMQNITATCAFTIKVLNFSGTLSREGVFPQIAAGAGWNTEIWLTANSLQSVPVRLRFFGRGGLPGLQPGEGVAPITPFQVEQQGSASIIAANAIDAVIPAHGTLILKTCDVSIGVQGWAEVLGNGDLRGFAVFRSSNIGQGVTPLQTEATMRGISVPFDNTTGQSAMGVAIANTASTPTAVSGVIWDESGNLLGTPDLTFEGNATWPAFSHTSFMLADFWAVTAGKRGHIDFVAYTGELAGIGLKVDLVNQVFVSMPVTPH